MTATALCLAVAAALLWPLARGANPWHGAPRGDTNEGAEPGAALGGAGPRTTARPQSAGQRPTYRGAGLRPTAGSAGRRPTSRGARRLPRRARARLQGDLADFVALLAAPLRAGATPALAVMAVARSMTPGPELRSLLADLVQAEAVGSGLTAVWLEHAERLGSPDLLFLARAWQLTERTGAPLAEALVSVEGVLRARQRARERVASAAAGPRSSMAVLVALPCAGPLVGLAFGIGPRSLYLSSAASLASGVLGLVLALLAWLWARRILAGALRSGSAWTGGTQP